MEDIINFSWDAYGYYVRRIVLMLFAASVL